ncbi:DUF6524 family protein [Cochlodiniinecator piscidefendens]|uniref:DUF6524 family protein n=1 Tax=Cochlodiniinecator piscidefendens TaxID=2715756 RepID=UPI00140B75EA|nr:DUF6524 family protein [Cochlodiniinecator piscidefendens]
MGIFLRWVFAFILVTATFNPTEWNYVRLVQTYGSERLSIAVLSGLILIICYIIYIRATLRSIGGFGMFLILAVLSSLIWVLVDFGLLTLESRELKLWIGVFSISVVLGIGLSWSHVRRMLSGQSDVDDLND